MWLAGAVPDPDNEMLAGEFVALLVTVTLPETLPAVVGANVALKEVDCPAARVRGSARPLALKPVPLTLTCERDTLELPVFVRATLCVALLPVGMLPNPTEVGDAVSCRTGETPVPARATTTGEFGVLFTSVRLPEKLLAEAGLKLTVKADDPPGGTESGKVSPDNPKPVPARDACVTLRFAVPGFVMVSVCVLVKPTVTLPKLTLAGITEICGCTPLPLREIVVGELVALLTTLRLPAALPAMAGVKLTERERLWPAARVTAPGKPLKEYPAPVMVICEMLTLPVPLLLTETA